ncbi:methyl-accepting chemotaxis protein [Blastopirellula marina]|uniref:Methyl-accepting chemotaxis protein n=1 Tax=Blastopirellula marina TaxID=124 RepID=A0A2S8F8B0_9BACT|nr:methyl-accepting chemotaxis protein [Blastopirellula marina]PQO28370.1 hypothetical protein C5Y98_26110 [Blastopirellula marina]PTL41910.1 HAMP domain-containing protein [Blastopirellula marina]
MLRRLSILQKTMAGFAIILLLMAISVGGAWYGISEASDGFRRYRKLARDSNFCSEMTDCVMQMRMIAKNFDISGRSEFVDQFHKKQAELDALIAQADERIVAPERRPILDEIRVVADEYYQAFTDIVECRQIRKAKRGDVLDVVGPQMVGQLKLIMDSAQADHDADAASFAGAALNDLMNARLNVFKLIVTNDARFSEATLKAIDLLSKNLHKLDAELQDPKRRELLSKTVEQCQVYQQAFLEMSNAFAKERGVVEGQLDVSGPQIAALAGKLNQEITGEQDGVGPEVEASNQATLVSITVVGIGALILGVMIATLQSRAIVLPIRRVMTILGAVSGGDLRQRLEVASQDEIGKMSVSVNQMVENLQRAMLALSSNSVAIARSAEDMNQTAESMANVSNDTMNQSSSAAAASEELSINMRSLSCMAVEMSTNMESVASSVEEMAISIEQIALNMEKVNGIAAEASQLSENSCSLLGNLDTAANEIGDVVELIQEIAEKTNLLALNATIEAARAGDSGKGFAVVAGEVKELARQTGDATGDIERRVDCIQSTSSESKRAIEEIRHVILKLNEVAQEIAAAVEEQSATTQEIANNVASANDSVQQVSLSVSESAAAGEEIARAVNSVDSGAVLVSDGAKETRGHSGSLTGISHELATLVGQFQV